MTTSESPGSAAGAPAAPARIHLAERLRAKIGEAAEGSSLDGHDTVVVPVARWLDAARALRDDEGYIRFIDVTAVDEPEQELRFELHLVVYSMQERRWARLKTRTADKVSSVVSLYAGAHNYEREVFDLFGVVFEGHPKLTRIMMPDGWQGHPLRRDFEMPVEPVDFTVTRDVYNT